MRLKELNWEWDAVHSQWVADSIVGELYVGYCPDSDTWECGYSGGQTMDSNFRNATDAKAYAFCRVYTDIKPYIIEEGD